MPGLISQFCVVYTVRTIITSVPSSHAVSKVIIILPCLATTDDSKTILRRWYSKNDINPIVPTSSIFVDQNGALNIDMRYDTDSGVARVGSYRCRVDNGLSFDEIVSNLTRTMKSMNLSTITINLFYFIFVLLTNLSTCPASIKNSKTLKIHVIIQMLMKGALSLLKIN